VSFSKLELKNFRCFDSISLDLEANSILLYGKNGCGKTSILEALYVATSGKSFRTSNLESLIKEGQKAFYIKAYDSLNGSVVEVSKERKQSIQLKINNSRVTTSELVRSFPSFSIDSKTFFYSENAPEYRRKHIDRALFVGSKEYAADWFGYFRSLKQRNSALKQGSSAQAHAYDSLLFEHGEKLNTQRTHLVQEVFKVYKELVSKLQHQDTRAKIFTNVSVELNPGFDTSIGLLQSLVNNINNDLRMKSTTRGPHKADLIFKANEFLIKDVFSRGEQKLLSIIWSISQNIFLKNKYQINPFLLLDDLSSELDPEILDCFLPVLKFIENRFIFSNIVDVFGSKIDDSNQNFKKFHVEQLT